MCELRSVCTADWTLQRDYIFLADHFTKPLFHLQLIKNMKQSLVKETASAVKLGQATVPNSRKASSSAQGSQQQYGDAHQAGASARGDDLYSPSHRPFALCLKWRWGERSFTVCKHQQTAAPGLP